MRSALGRPEAGKESKVTYRVTTAEGQMASAERLIGKRVRVSSGTRLDIQGGHYGTVRAVRQQRTSVTGIDLRYTRLVVHMDNGETYFVEPHEAEVLGGHGAGQGQQR